MVIDTSIVIKNYEGKEMLEASEGEDDVLVKKPLTLRSIFVAALNNMMPNEVFSAEQKTKVYGLSVKIYNNQQVDLTPEDIAFLKERVAVIWPSLVYGRICELFASDQTVN